MNTTDVKKADTGRLAEKLDKLLETYSLFYPNSKKSFSKITDENICFLQERFEAQYDDLLSEIVQFRALPRAREAAGKCNTLLHSRQLVTTKNRSLTESIKSAKQILTTLKAMNSPGLIVKLPPPPK